MGADNDIVTQKDHVVNFYSNLTDKVLKEKKWDDQILLPTLDIKATGGSKMCDYDIFSNMKGEDCAEFDFDVLNIDIELLKQYIVPFIDVSHEFSDYNFMTS